MGDLATRNLKLFIGFRATTRAILFAPYIFHFMTVIRGMSAEEYGILQAVYYVGCVLTEIPSGIAADRWGRKRTLFLGALAAAAGCLVFAHAEVFAIFVVGEILFAFSTALVSGADSALLYDSLAAVKREHEYPRAEGAAQATWLLVSALAFPLADLLLVEGDDPVLTYWATGFLSLIGAVLILFTVEPPVKRRATIKEITVGAAADVVRLPGVLRIIAYSMGLFLLLRAAMVSFYNPVLNNLGVPVDRFGLIFSVVNIVGAGVVFFMPRLIRRFGERGFVVAMPVAMVVMYALLTQFRAPAAAILFTIQGACFGAYPVLTRTMLNRSVRSPERRATILSIESMICRVAYSGVAVFAGWGLGALGLDTTLVWTAALCCLPFLLIPLLPRSRTV